MKISSFPVRLSTLISTRAESVVARLKQRSAGRSRDHGTHRAKLKKHVKTITADLLQAKERRVVNDHEHVHLTPPHLHVDAVIRLAERARVDGEAHAATVLQLVLAPVVALRRVAETVLQVAGVEAQLFVRHHLW